VENSPPDLRSDSAFALLLGSASPRRRDLLAMLGIPFVVHSADADETALPGEAPLAYVARVTRAKLDAVRRKPFGSPPAAPSPTGVLVADTVVVAPDGGLLGKPRDDREACAMLERLAGATHSVSTHFALAPWSAGADPVHAQTVTTRVTFRPLSPAEIHVYVAGGEGRDKAGAYAIQGQAAVFVERIDGSFTGVVGLPVCELVVALRTVGWLAPPRDRAP
jgi:septum formation protein